jgi:hypothetical protein
MINIMHIAVVGMPEKRAACLVLGDRFEQIVTGGKVGGNVNLENVRARFVTLVCVNEDGTRMFEYADSERIGELDTDIVQAIVDAGFKLNGIGVNAVEEAAGK